MAHISYPAPRRLRQKVFEFKGSLGHISQFPVSLGYSVKLDLEERKKKCILQVPQHSLFVDLIVLTGYRFFSPVKLYKKKIKIYKKINRGC